MLKVFYNKSQIFLTEDAGVDKLSQTRSKVVLSYHNRTELWEIIKYVETDAPYLEKVFITGRSFELLKQDFFACFTLVEAAGGVIINEKNQILLIFRKGKWDIPKGKVEAGESYDTAALREVSEETGITDVKIVHPLNNIAVNGQATWHFYKQKGERIIKPTYWFEMKCHSNVNFVPQIEEGIELMEWADREKLPDYYNNIYGSIRDVLDIYVIS